MIRRRQLSAVVFTISMLLVLVGSFVGIAAGRAQVAK